MANIDVTLVQNKSSLKLCEFIRYTTIITNTTGSELNNLPVSIPIPYGLTLKRNSVCVENTDDYTLRQYPYSFNNGIVSLTISEIDGKDSVIINFVCEKCNLNKNQNTYTCQVVVDGETSNIVNALNLCNGCCRTECSGC